MKKLLLSIFIIYSALSTGKSQESEYKLACIGFYNVENLFDVVNDTTINDEEFLPEGKNSWTKERYDEKISNIAYVISKMGTELTPFGPSILGLSEIENRKVIEDLVAHPLIKDRNYQIAHIDSPDKRGIDVGLIYRPDHFKVLRVAERLNSIHPITGDSLFTRNILHVTGMMDDDTIHVLVNHWPSRRGGEAKSAPLRNMSARTCQAIIDSIRTIQEDAKVIVLGDLNDNPDNESVRSYLRAKGDKAEVQKDDCYNPMYNLFRKGIGSNAYRDSWSLFDQIIITEGLVNKNQEGYFHYKTKIYNEKFLVRRKGQYKGYPKRTYAGGEYTGGYSDHFPVYIFLTKKIN